jgi:hypothetical protein
MSLTCAVGKFFKALNHVKVCKIEKDGRSDPFAKGRLVYVDSKISDTSIGQAFDYIKN